MTERSDAPVASSITFDENGKYVRSVGYSKDQIAEIKAKAAAVPFVATGKFGPIGATTPTIIQEWTPPAQRCVVVAQSAKDRLLLDMRAEIMRVGMGAPFDKARFSRFVERSIELLPSERPGE